MSEQSSSAASAIGALPPWCIRGGIPLSEVLLQHWTRFYLLFASWQMETVIDGRREEIPYRGSLIQEIS